MEMVVDKQNLFQIPSSEIVDRTIFGSEFMELKKKRKLQVEQLGLPLPKHKCGDGSFNSDPCLYNGSKKYKASDNDDNDDDVSRLESVKDSNSFVDESDSSISTWAESQMDCGNAKTCPSDWLCTPTTNDFNRIFNNNNSSMDGASSSSSIIIDPQNNNNLKLLQPYQDLHEFGSLMEYGYLEEQGMECEEKASDDEHCFDLSSGRWTVDQGKAVNQKREDVLTIDKEFEQYFSMLML